MHAINAYGRVKVQLHSFLCMEESGQLHALSTLPLACETKEPTEQDTGWAPELFKHSEERKIL